MNKIYKMSELKRRIHKVIDQWSNENEMPSGSIIIYNERMETPTFRITIEKLDVDYFIDSKGRKWVMIPGNDKDVFSDLQEVKEDGAN